MNSIVMAVKIQNVVEVIVILQKVIYQIKQVEKTNGIMGKIMLKTYDYSKNIKSSLLDKIANIRWNLGGYNTSSASALNMYNAERGTLHISNP